MKGGSFMANTEIFLRNIFGTTRPIGVRLK